MNFEVFETEAAMSARILELVKADPSVVCIRSHNGRVFTLKWA